MKNSAPERLNELAESAWSYIIVTALVLLALGIIIYFINKKLRS